MAWNSVGVTYGFCWIWKCIEQDLCLDITADVSLTWKIPPRGRFLVITPSRKPLTTWTLYCCAVLFMKLEFSAKDENTVKISKKSWQSTGNSSSFRNDFLPRAGFMWNQPQVYFFCCFDSVIPISSRLTSTEIGENHREMLHIEYKCSKLILALLILILYVNDLEFNQQTIFFRILYYLLLTVKWILKVTFPKLFLLISAEMRWWLMKDARCKCWM